MELQAVNLKSRCPSAAAYRGFWLKATDTLAASSIRELIEYIDNQVLLGELIEEDFPRGLVKRASTIADQLDGNQHGKQKQPQAATEDEFIKREFEEFDIGQLCLDGPTQSVVNERIQEIRKCLSAGAPLSVVFLCGSTLEGILLAAANNYPKKFNQSSAAPKKEGKALPFHGWRLASLIDVGREVGILGEDVKKHSHALRDFRNYIHPLQQLASGFSPHEHTAKISWQVLQAAVFEITEYRKNEK